MIEMSGGFSFIYGALGATGLILASGFAGAVYADRIIQKKERRKNIGLIGGMFVAWLGVAIDNFYWSYTTIVGTWGMTGSTSFTATKIALILPLTGKGLVLVGGLIHLHTLALNRRWSANRLLFCGSFVFGVGALAITAHLY